MKTIKRSFQTLLTGLGLIGLAIAMVGCGTDEADTHSEAASSVNDTERSEAALVAQDLVGEWGSESCEAYPDGQGNTNYVTRTFTLTQTDWDLNFTVFGDDACSFPLFSSNVGGSFGLQTLSSNVEGATEGTFELEYNDWTAHADNIVTAFEQSGCGTDEWSVGVAQDVTETGCFGVAKPTSDCSAEYDIVSIDGDKLFFGERITNMCAPEGRPAALNSYAVVRQSS